MKKILPFIFLFALVLPAGLALLSPGLPPTHDGEYHIIRFYEFDRAIQNGQWYPRWAPDLNNGYGVPLFNYVYPLPNYVASLFHVFGFSFIDAFKLNMFLALVIGACFMYLWVRSYFGTLGGIISAVFYTYAPYHLLDIYIRGSVGEVWALAFFPAFLWSANKLIKERKMLFFSLISLFLALIIFSHNILSLMFFPLAISYMLFLIFQQERSSLDRIPLKRYFVNLFIVVALGLGLASIFWLPAIFERAYVRGLEIFEYSRHFVEPYQLIFPSWGSGFSADSATEGLSFQIGVANLVALVTLASFVFLGWRKYKNISTILFLFFWIVIAIFLMLPISQFVWDNVPFMQYFQFPWRFLSLVILCCAFLAGSVVFYKKSMLLFLAMLFLPVILGIGYTNVAYYHQRDDMYYITRSNFIDGTNSPGNAFNTVWFDTSLPKKDASSFTSENATIINIAYFPGWQVFVNEEAVGTRVSSQGLIEIDRIEKNNTIEAKFLDTVPRTIGKFLSGLSLVVILLLHLRRLLVRISSI